MIEISPIELYEFLESKGFHNFYHANTVRTACSLINQKGLLSRCEMMKRNLPMTPQASDQIDKDFNVWNDIFFDIVDLHGYFPRQNLYGPICFIISNKFLLDENLPNICITKNNPIYWTNELTIPEKYYSSVYEYKLEFDNNLENKQIQSKMFTIHNTDKKIPFAKYLTTILLDNPSVKIGSLSLYQTAKQAVVNALSEAKLDIDLLKTRQCFNCYCKNNYLNQIGVDELKKLFLP